MGMQALCLHNPRKTSWASQGPVTSANRGLYSRTSSIFYCRVPFRRQLHTKPGGRDKPLPKMVSKRIARAVVFDMDGTLTKPVLDFAEMRRRANILVGDVLEVLEAMPKRERDRIAAIIEDFEDEALPRMAINDGVHELCTLLDNAGMPRALLTRNTAKAVSYFHENHFTLPPFSPALARDFRPFKPSPAAILHICKEWGISPSETVMVGDSLKDDVVCGNRAGASTIFLDYDGKAEVHRSAMVANEELQPDFIARSMHEVAQILQMHFVLGGSAGREIESLQEQGIPEHLQTGE